MRVERRFAVPVAPRVQPFNTDANESQAPAGRFAVNGRNEHAQMPSCLGRNHPAAKCLRVLAVHLGSTDPIIECLAVLKLKLSLKINFDQSAAVGFLRLVKLVKPVTSRSLPVIKLVQGVANDLGCS